MPNIDLSRVNEDTLDSVLREKDIDPTDMDLLRKILEYRRQCGTDNPGELYVDLNPPKPSKPKKPKKKKIPRLSAGKKQKSTYDGGTIESWDSAAKIRSNEGIVSTLYTPQAYDILFETFNAHKVRNGDSKYLTIAATCPKIPTAFAKIRYECQYTITGQKPIPKNKTSIHLGAQGRVDISKEDFDSWYEAAVDWFAGKDITPDEVKSHSQLEKRIRDHVSELGSGDFDAEKSRQIAETAKTSVSLVNQIYKANPPGWKRELIERVQEEIRQGLKSGNLDLYNRLSMTRFTKFLKDHGIEHDDVYEAVVEFKDRFGLDAFIPFIKYDRAETAGCDAGIDYSPSFIVDFRILPKAKRVEYREEHGFKAKFFEDQSFESNFQVSCDIDELQQFHDTVQDIHNLIRHKFIEPDEKEAQRYETRLYLRAYLATMENLRKKGDEPFLHMSFNAAKRERYRIVSNALGNSNKFMEGLLV